jgi:Fic family protein
MTSITTKTINGKKYKYLKFPYREKGEIKHIEMAITANGDIYQQKVDQLWVPVVDKIKKRYQRDLSKYTFTTKEKFFEDFGIRFTHQSNKIEGSTLDLKEVRGVILDRITPGNKPLNDVEEAQAHQRIFHEMLDRIDELSMPLILHWHQILFWASNPQIAGQTRNCPISISGSNYTPPRSKIEVELGLGDLFKWYSENKDILHPVLLACIMTFRFVSIHPFEDGNGRISRIIMNYLLHQAGYPMFNIGYNIRLGYYNALEDANLKEDELRFVQWFFSHYIKGTNDT